MKCNSQLLVQFNLDSNFKAVKSKVFKNVSQKFYSNNNKMELFGIHKIYLTGGTTLIWYLEWEGLEETTQNSFQWG